MSGLQVRTISLSHEFEQFVAAQVASDQYSSSSEMMRAGLRARVAQQVTLVGGRRCVIDRSLTQVIAESAGAARDETGQNFAV